MSQPRGLATIAEGDLCRLEKWMVDIPNLGRTPRIQVVERSLIMSVILGVGRVRARTLFRGIHFSVCFPRSYDSVSGVCSRKNIKSSRLDDHDHGCSIYPASSARDLSGRTDFPARQCKWFVNRKLGLDSEVNMVTVTE